MYDNQIICLLYEMRIRSLFLLIGLYFTLQVHAQENGMSRILSVDEMAELFSDSVKVKYDIKYPIRRVYAYDDQSGKYLMVLTESINSIENNDTIHHRIKAFHFKEENNCLTKVRDINDAVEEGEPSIWFWTRYCRFIDVDNDGIVEPIIVYGASYEELESFRVKILIYYKNKKYAIRHHNCDLDDCRFTQIDREFYSLPEAVKKQTRNIIKMIEENGHAYFGHWEDAMMRKAINF